MKKQLILTIVLGGLISTLGLQAQSSEELLTEAKLAMFDENWEEALEKILQLRSRFPNASVRSQSLFYEARILEHMDKELDALNKYEAFTTVADSVSPLRKDALYSTIKLSVKLYMDGVREYIDRALDALKSSDNELRLFSALQLSYLSDPEVKSQAVPVLREALDSNVQNEIRNQATLALLRIDPRLLEEQVPAKKSPEKGTLNLSILRDTKQVFSLSLPISLARMLFSALPEEAKEKLSEEGINTQNLLDELEQAGEIIEVRSGQEVIRISVQ